MSGGDGGGFLRDAAAGLGGSPRRIPGKHLWDAAGSSLFDAICDDPSYYPIRAEAALLPQACAAVAERVGPGASVVEYGSGASRKVRVLLDALAAPARYLALDISGAYGAAAVARLAPDYPDVAMRPVEADYAGPIRLDPDWVRVPVLGFFPGTSIGNLAPAEAAAFLDRARETLGPGSRLLIGIDALTDPGRLAAAYGSPAMAAFHRNLLVRLGRDLGAEVDCDAFRHEARVHDDPFRVEAHLVARRPSRIRLGSTEIAFAEGESLRTDVSHKIAPEAARALAAGAGWTPEALWRAEPGFTLHLFRA